MATEMSNVSIRMPTALKNQVASIFESMGMDMTTGMTVYAKAVARRGKIPFEIVGDPFYCEANQAWIRRAVEEFDAGARVVHDLIEDDADEA